MLSKNAKTKFQHPTQQQRTKLLFFMTTLQKGALKAQKYNLSPERNKKKNWGYSQVWF